MATYIHGGRVIPPDDIITDEIRGDIDARSVKNVGELPKYYVHDCHPAIIDRETFRKVQDEIAWCASKRRTSSKAKTELDKYSGKFALSELLVCGECSNPYRRQTYIRCPSFYTPLRSALTEAGYDDNAKPHKFLITGDLFDRGRDAAVLQSFILDLLERDAGILIRGNHEDLFEELATVDNGLRYEHHLSNGTYGTALQLTGFDKRHAKVSPLEFARAARETPCFKTTLPAMIDYYETENFIYFTDGYLVSRAETADLLIWTIGGMHWSRAGGRPDGSTASTLSERYLRMRKPLSADTGTPHTATASLRGKGRSSAKIPIPALTSRRGSSIALDACTAYSGIANCIIVEDGYSLPWLKWAAPLPRHLVITSFYL